MTFFPRLPVVLVRGWLVLQYGIFPSCLLAVVLILVCFLVLMFGWLGDVWCLGLYVWSALFLSVFPCSLFCLWLVTLGRESGIRIRLTSSVEGFGLVWRGLRRIHGHNNKQNRKTHRRGRNRVTDGQIILHGNANIVD